MKKGTVTYLGHSPEIEYDISAHIPLSRELSHMLQRSLKNVLIIPGCHACSSKLAMAVVVVEGLLERKK